MPEILSLWQQCRAIGEDLERSYEIANKHYHDPPFWLVGLPVVYERALRAEWVDRMALGVIGGYLRNKFPPFAEYCMAPEEQRLRDQLAQVAEGTR